MNTQNMPNDRRIKPAQNDILRTIVAGIDSFSTGQRRVASVIVADPLWAVHANVRDLAERASVSPPTIVRFARAVGCAGLKDFKIRLAGALALGTPYLHRSVRSDDSTTEVLRNIVGSVTSAVADWQRRIDPQALEKAAAAINAAGRVDCFGTGLTSNFLAEDMQARFFRLGLVSHTFSDAHLQLVAASTLSTRDVLIAISYVGRMPNLLEAVRVARARGATIVAITRSNTPLAALSDVLLSVDVQEDVTMRVGTEAYVVQLLLLEMLMVLIGLKRGGPTLSRLRRIHDVLHTHGSDGDDSEVHWAGC